VAILFAAGFLALGQLAVSAQRDITVNDKDIKVVDFEDLRYPAPARATHSEGVVVVKLTLNDHGDVSDAVALSGANSLLQDTVLNARKWRFKPNTQNTIILVYNFRILDGLCKSDTSQFAFHAPNFISITTCELPLQP
jgi:TonB family protein